MARNAEIKGSVAYDVTFDADDGIARLMSAVEGVTARIDVAFSKTQVRSALKEATVGLTAKADVAFGKMQVREALKVATAGYKHKVDVSFGKMQLRKALKVASEGATVKADVSFGKIQMRKAIKEATAGLEVRLDVDANDLTARVTTIVAKAEKATTQIHERENERRKTLDKRLRNETEIAEKRADERLRILKQQRSDALIRLDRQDAQIRERINAQLNARLEAQNNQARLREQYALARARERLERQTSKPLIQRVIVQTDKINASLTEFDRTMTRALRTSLTAFTVWSAGVTAAIGAATGAALVSFAKMEQEVARAGAVFASDAFYGNLIRGEKQLRSFKEEADFTGEAVRQLSNSIALETLFNPREIAEGAKAMAQAGVSLVDTQSELLAVAQFAQNEQIDLAEATEKLTGSINSAGLGMNRLTDLTDKFTLAANATNATASEMADAFSNQAAAAFRSYGYEVDEAITTIGLFAKANLRGLEAGTQTSILVREITRSAFVKAPDVWKKYGIALEDAQGKAVPFNETLVSLVTLLEETRKEKGNRGMAKLRKELELTEKSMRGLTILQPLVNELGIDGLGEFTKMLNNSADATSRQASVVTDTIAFEWGNLLENIAIQFQNFGSKSSEPLKRLFDQFNGAGGIIDDLSPKVEALGEQFAVLVDRFADWVTSPEAARGAATLVDSIRITLVGVREAFQVFAEAFDEGEDAKSTFEAVADSIKAFATVSATTLPVVAEILGEIFDLLIDNADAFETFAKIALTVYALRKAYVLVVQPIATVTGLVAAQATAYGLMGGAADKATASIGRLTAAQIAQATASTSSTVAAGGGALGMVPGFPGRGMFRQRNRAAGIGAEGRAGANALGQGGAVAGGALAARNAAAFERLAGAINKANKPATAIARTLGKVALVGAVVVGAFDLVTGAIDGFRDRWEELQGSARFEDFRIGLEGIQFVLGKLGDALGWIGDRVQDVGRDFGAFVADRIFQFVSAIGGAVRFVKMAVDAIADAFRAMMRAIGDAIAGFLRNLAGMVSALSRIPGFGKKFRGWADELNGAADSADKFGEEVDKVKRKAEDLTAVPIRKWLRDTENDVWVLNQEWVRNRKLLEVAGNNAGSAAKRIADGVLSYIPGATRALNNFNEALRTAAANRAADAAFTSTFESATEGRDVGALTPNAQADALTRAGNAASLARLRALELYPAAQKAKKAIDEVTGGSRPKTGGGSAGGGSAAADTPAAREIREIASAADQARAAVDKMSGSTLQQRALETIGKATRGAAGGYKATRVEAEILRRVLPSLDRELESQRSAVEKLDQALQDLQSTQIAGTRAFSDQLFANEQQVKALQLQRVDLIIGGASEDDSSVATIDEQIRALQLQAERTSLTESLQLDPLRRKLEDAFNPLNELPFDQIMAKLKAIGEQRAPLADAIAGGENLRTILDKTIGEAEQRFETAGKDVSAGLARGVIAGSKQLLAAGRNNGASVLQGLDAVMEFGSPSRTTTRLGQFAAQGLANGILSGAPGVNAAAITVADNAMVSFLVGLKQGFGTPQDEGTPAWYLNVFIPDWIRKNKGPLAYDSTILVPAGHAIMEGFGKGLRDGFGQVTGFVKEVGPSLGEYISSDLFSDRTAQVMADIAIGKTPDIEGVFGDLRAAASGGIDFNGVLDPTLAFLHQTMSLKDTQVMAGHLAKLFGLTVTSVDRPFGGPNPNSRHPYGEAADLSNGSQPTPQMDALYAATKPLLGKIFDQILYRTMIGGNHFNHVHLDWIAARGFSKNSGKLGGFDIPGVGGVIEAAISAAATRYSIPPALIAAIAKQESGFRPNVVSPDGGYGLMQLTSAGLVAQARAKGNIFDPFVNVDVGARYFKTLLEMFDGNIFKALMGYNGGPGAAASPFSQVIKYANSVLSIFRQFGGAREMGGPVTPGKTYLVGEKGPELWTPSRAGAIVDAATTGRIMAGNQTGAAGPVYHDYSTTTVTTAATDPDIVAAKLDRRRKRRLAGVNLR